ncbi:MAG: hypothetical protein LUE99_09715 [Bacteroides sp.]|nr:hypothetical protein [Bacteroides sp.]
MNLNIAQSVIFGSLNPTAGWALANIDFPKINYSLSGTLHLPTVHEMENRLVRLLGEYVDFRFEDEPVDISRWLPTPYTPAKKTTTDSLWQQEGVDLSTPLLCFYNASLEAEARWVKLRLLHDAEVLKDDISTSAAVKAALQQLESYLKEAAAYLTGTDNLPAFRVMRFIFTGLYQELTSLFNELLAAPGDYHSWKDFYYEVWQKYPPAVHATDSRLPAVSSKMPRYAISQAEQEKISHSLLHFVSGCWEQEKIFSHADDYTLMLEYTDSFLCNHEVPQNVKPLRPHVPATHIRYAYYQLYYSFQKSIARDLFIDFLHAVFPSFSNTEKETTRKKFSVKPETYDNDIKGILHASSSQVI